MDALEALLNLALFLVSLAIIAAMAWGWLRLGRKSIRLLDWALASGLALFLGASLHPGLRPSSQSDFALWAWASFAVAGILFAHGYQRLRSADGTDQVVVLALTFVSVAALLTFLNLFWAAGSAAMVPGGDGWAAQLLNAPLRPADASGPLETAQGTLYERWIKTAIPAIYAAALAAPTLLGLLLAAARRSRPRWSALLLAGELVLAFALGTFFWPVEFLNSCRADAFFGYVLC